MAIGPTRVEVIGDLIDVVRADYNRAFTKKKSNCSDCDGACVVVTDTDNETDATITCLRCNGTGFEEFDTFESSSVPEDLRPYVTGYKAGYKGRLLPEFRNKDKAASELMKAISNGWLSDYRRNPYGGDHTAADEIEEAPVDMSREAILAQYHRIAMTTDGPTALQALNAIAKLQGYVNEDDEGLDNQPLTMQDVTEFLNSRLRKNGRKSADESAAEAAAANAADEDEPLDPRDVPE